MSPELVVADRHGTVTGSASKFTKARPPVLGDKFAPTFHDDRSAFYTLPGGGLLHFDLDKLTLADYRSMRNHYQINISLSLLTFMIHQSDWKIECKDPDIKLFVEEQLHENWTRLIRAISPAYWAGYSAVALEWENDGRIGKITLNKLKDIAPEEAYVNWKEVQGYKGPSSSIPPKIKVFDGIKMHGHQDPIPVVNSFWYPLMSEHGDMSGRKLLKPAFPSWFFSQIMHLYSNRYFERFGEPLPIGRAPFDETVSDGAGGTQTGKEVMESILGSIRNRSAVVLPNDKQSQMDGTDGDYEYEISYLDSQMKGADFERYMNRLDEEMSLGIFTPVLLYRTADVGSYNLGEAHMQIFLVMINSLISDLADYINRFILDRLVDFNYSPNAPRARMSPRKLGKETQATLRTILQSMIQTEKAKVDVDDLGQALGMKIHEIRTVVDAEGNETTETTETPGISPSRLSAAIDRLANHDVTNGYKGLPGRLTFENALMTDGEFTEPRAKEIAYELYASIDHWVRDAKEVGLAGEELASCYERVVRAKVAEL